MVVIGYGIIREFIAKHLEAEDALNNWYKITGMADWRNFHQMKLIFNSVDAVGNDLYVFNIRGNKYRLIARIISRVRTVFVKFVGTHQDYDRVELATL